MKTSKISNLFEGGGIIVQKSKKENLFDLQYNLIVSLFEKYGLIIFRGFELDGNEITRFTDIYTEVYSGDALRREIRFDNKKIRNVDYGLEECNLHSESSFSPSFPGIVWFFCHAPPTTGRETILCDGIKLWNSISTETKVFLISEQIHYQLIIPVIMEKIIILKAMVYFKYWLWEGNC